MSLPPAARLDFLWFLAMVALFGFALVTLCLAAVVGPHVRVWMDARRHGVPIKLRDVIGLTFRKINARAVVGALTTAAKHGVRDEDLTLDSLAEHYLNGGNVKSVVAAMIEQGQSFRQAAAADLAEKAES